MPSLVSALFRAASMRNNTTQQPTAPRTDHPDSWTRLQALRTWAVPNKQHDATKWPKVMQGPPYPFPNERAHLIIFTECQAQPATLIAGVAAFTSIFDHFSIHTEVSQGCEGCKGQQRSNPAWLADIMLHPQFLQLVHSRQTLHRILKAT
jgi:hypothetical protein